MNTVQITIAGHTADVPEVRFTPNGKATARMRVAVNSRYQDSAGEWVEAGTSWYTVIAWGQLAENVAASVGKGDRVIVAGRFAQRDYDTEAGDKRTRVGTHRGGDRDQPAPHHRATHQGHPTGRRRRGRTVLTPHRPCR